MTREQIYAYVGFDRVPRGIDKFFVEEKFERWTPKKGSNKEARAKWRYIDRGDEERKPTMGHVYGSYQQRPHIQEELVPQGMGPFAAIIKFEADTGLLLGTNDKEVLQAKIEQTVDALLSNYASIGATRYTHEDVLRKSTA